MKLEKPLLRRAYLSLEDGEWGRADDYCERVLDQEPENAQAYVIKLMARLKVDTVEKLGKVEVDYEQWYSYRKAYHFADEGLKQELTGYLEGAKKYIQEEKRRREEEEEAQRKAERERLQAAAYNDGLRYSKEKASYYELKKARDYFAQAQDFKDAKERIRVCEGRIAAIEKERKLLELQEYEREKKKKRRIVLIVTVVLVSLVLLGAWGSYSSNVTKAEQVSINLAGMEFSGSKSNYVTSNASGESFGLAKEMTEYIYTLYFKSDGTVRIDIEELYDEEPFITKNGQRQWDSKKEYVKTVIWGEVDVSIMGKITVQIDGIRCKIMVNENNVPISLIWNGTTCEAD